MTTTQAAQECFVIDALTAAFAKAGLGALPTAHMVKSDDGSILLEWIRPDARLLVNLEVDPCHSSWGVVSKRGDMEWGDLTTFDADKAVALVWGEAG